MIPHDAMVATTGSLSNHCSRKSAAPLVMSWTNATWRSEGSSRNRFASEARGSHWRGSRLPESGGTTDRIGLMNRTISTMSWPNSW